MSSDLITLSTFGMQEKWVSDKEAVKKFIEGQIENIKALKESFDAAATEVHREPPEFVLSAIMIPQWKSRYGYTGQTYETEEYKAAKEEYFDYLREKCKDAGIKVQDFYEEVATEDEKKYLHQLEALGSTADLIKNRAIINNQGKRHLQIDTNTIIVDRKAFYKSTIGAVVQKDGMNASYYDDSGTYVSPHNKVVYTSENSLFARNLARQHNDYVKKNKDRLDRKTPYSNQIYSVVYSHACLETGLVSLDRKYYEEWNNLWGYFPVDLDHPTFEMTKHIITAINMSWSQGDGKVDYCAALKAIKVPIQSADGETTILDFQSFAYLIKKYTNPKLSKDDRPKLMKISDIDFDNRAIKSFVLHVINTRDISLLGRLLRTIPDNRLGQPILAKLFDTVKDTPEFIDIVKNPNITNKVTPEVLNVIARFIPEGSVLQKEKENIRLRSQQLLSSRVAELEASIEQIKDDIYKAVKAKLDELDTPYVVTEEDRVEIYKLIDSLSQQGCMEDLSIDEFKKEALSTAINEILNAKLKQQPEVLKALQEQEAKVQEIIRDKIYKAPLDEKFNRNEIDKMVGSIVAHIGHIRAESTRKAFYEDDQVKEFIKSLDALATLRPIDPNREIQIERIAEALITSVRELSKTAEAPADMSDYLRSHYDKLEGKYPSAGMSYNDLLKPDKTTILTHEAIPERTSQFRVRLAEVKGQVKDSEQEPTPIEPCNTMKQ